MFVVLDLDEVLVDFTGGAAKAHGKTVEEMAEIYGDWWSGDSFWGGIRDYGECRFWEELTFLPWSKELLLLVNQVAGRENWIIATSPSRDPDCYIGKIRFLRAAYGEEFNRYLITPHKELLAKEGRVLIDDSEKNCSRFERQGGKAILFPSRFNSNRQLYSDPLDYVRFQLKEIQNAYASEKTVGGS